MFDRKKILSLFLCATAIVLLTAMVVWAARGDFFSVKDQSTGTDVVRIPDSTSFDPGADGVVEIGYSGMEFADIHLEAITLGGQEKTSWGSVVSPMTDASGYVYPTDSGGVYRMYDAGYLALGANTAVDTYILFDTDDDDFYFGRDDTDNDCAWGVGSTLGADERISVVDSAVLTHIVIGDNADSEDKYIIFDGNATDQYLGYLDTYDMVCMGDGSTMDADMAFGIENATTPLLVLWNGIDGYGAVDIDYGSADITDHTFVSDGGTTIIDGTITLTDSEVISNATDDTIRVASNDADTIFEVYTPFDTTGDATLKLSADLGDAVKEQWTITSTGDGNDLVVACDTGVSGTPVTQLTVADGGVMTTIAAINVEIDDSANTSITDVLNLQHFTSGTAGTGIGAGLTFDIENATGTEEEHASIDAVATTSTNGSEDTDIVFRQMVAGAVTETVRFDADSGVAITSAVASQPLLTVTSTIVAATSGGTTYKHTRGGVDAVDGDDIHTDIYQSYDDGTPTTNDYVTVLYEVTDSAVGAEDGNVKWSVSSAGASANFLELDGVDGIELNAGTIDIDTHIDGNDQADLLKVDAGSNDVMVTRDLAAANTDAALLQVLNDNIADDQSAVSIIHDANATATNPAVSIQTTSAAFDQSTLFINHDGTAGATGLAAVVLDSQMVDTAALYITSPVDATGTSAIFDDYAVAIVSEGVGGGLCVHRDVSASTEHLVKIHDDHADGTSPALYVLSDQDASADDSVVHIETTSSLHDQAALQITQDGTYALLISDGGMTASVEDKTTTTANPGVATATLTTIITTVTTDETGDAADEISLANGTKGDIKIFTLKADTETAGLKIVPATFNAGTYILLQDVGDGCILIFDGTSWNMVANNGGTVG